MEVGNVVQIITDIVCKATSMLIELEFPSIYWTTCVVHTLLSYLDNHVLLLVVKEMGVPTL